VTLSAKKYTCALCGHEKPVTTNHRESCWDFCPTCSWKGIGHGEGLYFVSGPPFRRFLYMSELTESEGDAP
jgi:hypothetical protein